MSIHTKPVSWQLLHPPVMPVWICAVVGIGVRKAVPGAVFVAAAGTIAVGVVPRWQVSHVVDDGMCDVALGGDVAGITTIFGTPTKVVPVIDGPWQATQLLVMPLWLISEPENLAPLGTGVAGTLDPVPTWHSSHDAVVGMWLPGKPTIEKFAEGIAKLGAAVPWHCAQLVVVLGAFAWMFASVGITAKSADVWQAAQVAAAAVGMWLAGLSCAEKKVVPLWQFEQSPVVGWAASATLNVPAAVRGRVWKPVYCAPVVSVVGEIG
jgi:hypothetical protein